jgi:hypothetical protein
LKTQDYSIEFTQKSAKVLGSKQIQIYSQYWLVNKTNFAIDFGKDASKVTVPGHSSGMFYSAKNKVCLRLTGDVYGAPTAWSKKFAINTVGITGVLELDNKAATRDDSAAPKHVMVGVAILQPQTPLTKSTVIQIVPRYIFHNYLGYPIKLKQFEGDKIITLESDENILW